jgi:hypothetical protein
MFSELRLVGFHPPKAIQPFLVTIKSVVNVQWSCAFSLKSHKTKFIEMEKRMSAISFSEKLCFWLKVIQPVLVTIKSSVNVQWSCVFGQKSHNQNF